MKKLLIAGIVVLLLAAAGGGWFVFRGTGDPVQAARDDLQKGDVRTAMIQLRNAVRDTPGRADAHALLAQVQLGQGDAVAAEKEIKTARDLNWDKVATAAVLGQSYVIQGKWKEVIAEVPELAPTPDQTAAFLVMRAAAQNGLDDRPAAKASVAAAQAAAPANVDARVAAARIAIIERDLKAAEAKIDEALAINPKRADALQLKSQIRNASGDSETAVALMDQAVDAVPTSSLMKLERAGLLLGLGRDAKARADVDAVLAKEPRNFGATYASMVLLVRAGKFAEADQALQRLGAVVEGFPRGLYFQALIKANLGQTEQATDAAARYAARTPNDPDGIRLLARTELAAKRPARAIDTLSKAVEAGQTDAETFDLLGRAYTVDGKRPEAARAFQRASSAAPGDANILTRLASSKLEMGDVAGATSALERSLEITPAQAGAGEALVAAALSTGDLDRAETALERLRQQVGDTETVSTLSGLIRMGRLDTDAAREQFEATVRKFPASVAAKANLAKVLFQQDRRPEAVALLKQGINQDPGNATALAMLVQILTQEKRGPEAIAAVEAARAAQPQNLAFTAGHAELLTLLGDPAGALAVLEAAKVNGTTPAPLLPVLARVQVTANKVDAAKATFAQILAANPTDFATRRAQVEVLASTGDTEAVRTLLQEGLQASPGNPGLLSLLVLTEQRAKGFDAAIALADQLRANPGNMPAAMVLKGDLYAAARRFSEAASAYAAELKTTNSPLLAVRLASAQLNAGDPNKALADLRAWQAKQPGDPDAAQMLASMDINARRYADAERNLGIVLEKRPNDPIALNNLAWLYGNRRDPRAHNLAQRAYLQAPSAETSDTLGWIMVSEGQAAKAVPLLQQAAAQQPANRTVRLHLATALKAVGRRDDATAILRLLVDDAADYDGKAEARQMLSELAAGR